MLQLKLLSSTPGIGTTPGIDKKTPDKQAVFALAKSIFCQNVVTIPRKLRGNGASVFELGRCSRLESG